MNAIELLKTRRSIRAYQPQPIPRDVLMDIVDCARMAPTAMNNQPWEFVIVTDPTVKQTIGQMISYSQFLATAPALIVVLCRDMMCYLDDASAATQNLLLAAHAHGIGSCWIGAHKQPFSESLRKLVSAPAELIPVNIVTLGYPAENPAKEKRSLESMLHWERF
jgi:nitroreductase